MTKRALIYSEIYRYKILIDVVHDDVKTTFVLWDRECLQLLKLTSAQMRSNMLEAGITDPLEFPLVLDDLVGLDMAFKVKWQPSWDNATVVSISDKTDRGFNSKRIDTLSIISTNNQVTDN
ncbi:uncharacterized protein LOC131599472 [Vicia villosa]|uniref:uncharacterized protein LOC131599472 n=1 Tax=Vicia villosa TaxID=3911 RepID=UPI00273BB9B6|nr:uncharacterized protein LOC131599472 [Vicia villosa]